MKNKYYQIAGYILSFLLIWMLIDKAKSLDFTEIGVYFKLSDIVLLVLILLIGYGVKVFRWKVLLKSVNLKYRYFDLYSHFIISIGINNLLPLRAGDAYRVFGVEGEATKTQLFSTLIFERILDALSLFFLLIIWLIISNIVIPVKYIYIISGVLVALISFLAAFYFLVFGLKMDSFVKMPGWILKVKRLIEDVFLHIRAFLVMPVIFKIVPLSLIGWLPESLIFYLVAKCQGLKLSYSVTALSQTFATLSTMIPSLPGYFGTFHYAIYSILRVVNIAESKSLVFAVLSHFFLWAPPVIVSVILFAFKKILPQK